MGNGVMIMENYFAGVVGTTMLRTVALPIATTTTLRIGTTTTASALFSPSLWDGWMSTFKPSWLIPFEVYLRGNQGLVAQSNGLDFSFFHLQQASLQQTTKFYLFLEKKINMEIKYILIAVIVFLIYLLVKKKEKASSLTNVDNTTSKEETSRVNIQEVKSHLGEFVKVEGGRFNMGSPETEQGRFNDEVLHPVELSTFFMQTTPVTQGLYTAVMGTNPSARKEYKDMPVTNVSWEDAQVFIEKLNDLMGTHYRLPTEAEWEYAARGGNRSQGYVYSGSNDLNEVGWYNENSGNHLHVVKEKKPNELGIYDMSGNVWEWCSDWYAQYRLDQRGSVNPQGADNGERRVLRGGSWRFLAQHCRVANRGSDCPEDGSYGDGFRLVFSE
jgi:formylglycine-generating enzyme required for sulfatase activity